MQATVAVYISGSTGSSEGDSVSFPWCFMRSTSVIQCSQHPVATMSACGLVGGLDVKIDFVPKFDIVGLVGVISWLALLFFKII